MNSPKRIEGAQCLEHVGRPIGFCSLTFQSASQFKTQMESFTDPRTNRFNSIIKELDQNGKYDTASWMSETAIAKFKHDTSKRIVGVVTDTYDDGGMRVVILGSETFDQTDTRYTEKYSHKLLCKVAQKYDVSALSGEFNPDGAIPIYPEVIENMTTPTTSYSVAFLYDFDFEHVNKSASYETMTDYHADFENYNIVQMQNNLSSTHMDLTTDPNNTLIFGEGETGAFHMNVDLMGDPLQYLQGDLYDLATNKCIDMGSMIPRYFPDEASWRNFEADLGEVIYSYNMCCVPYNLLLTESLQFAQAYLTDGTLPPDAYMFPLDWSKLPNYEKPDDPDDPSDNPPDEPDDNTPNDENDDIIDNPPVAPDYTPAMFSNYNWYWLSIGDYSAFINWFWNDIGNVADFEDLVQKIQGLYNDLASAVIMIRYMPVNPAFIGGLGGTDALKIGMIQKANNSYQTLAMNRPPIVEIGRKEITRKYNSFLDLAPYSQLSLYLPYHGYIDLDINIFSGHWLYVYGVYDVLSGTLQYMIYRVRDGARMLVNTVVCKIAVDIPITLQTKNDRDSAIFQNVSSTIGGLIGAVGGVASGNPIGAMLGVTSGINALTSSNASAPLNVKGTVAETGAMYAPHKCSIIVRHPSIQGSDSGNAKATWLKHVGRATSFGYKLGAKDMKGTGLTICTNPRITFNNSTPLQTEVDEIYEYLEKGVIL